MWRQVTLDVHLDHPPARVFPYFADPGTWPAWAPAVEVRERIGDGPTIVGSRWAAVDRIIGPFRVRFWDELEVVEPDQRVVWHSTSPWNSRVEYACSAEGGGTRVHADYGGDVAGWLRLVALLPTFVLARILMRDFVGLQRLLDAEDARAGAITEPR
ncbi:SRPBCC family protein [Microbacterium sp. NPDC056569]|uniref:SRPBCC family protein n=1 Tax=Microbacterium sp. NPDC056569 TaxID=3345867 RepID=UPI00366FC2C7